MAKVVVRFMTQNLPHVPFRALLRTWLGYRRHFTGRLEALLQSAESDGDVAEWFRQGPAKPCTWVRFPASPLFVVRIVPHSSSDIRFAPNRFAPDGSALGPIKYPLIRKPLGASVLTAASMFGASDEQSTTDNNNNRHDSFHGTHLTHLLGLAVFACGLVGRNYVLPTVRHLCPFQLCASQVCASQVCASQVCGIQVCVSQVCVIQLSASQVCASQDCAK